MSRSPLPEKYASAFSPPFVNCLTFRRRFSEGNSTGEGLFTGLCPTDNNAADRPTRRARGNTIFVLINPQGKRPQRDKGDSTKRPYFTPRPPLCQAHAPPKNIGRGAGGG